VEVETKWLLGVFVEGCIGLSSIIGHLIVMVHLPYASHYSIPFFLSIYSIKSFWRQMTGLVRTSMNTIECLQLVLHEFSGPPGGVGGRRRRAGSAGGHRKRKKKEEGVDETDREMDWTCSICFEESRPEDASSDSPSSTSSSSDDSCVDHPRTRHHGPSSSSSSSSSRKRATPPTHDESPVSQHDDDGSSHDSGDGDGDGDVEGHTRLVNRCVLNCRHTYHTDCLVKWLHYQAFCPVCHRPVL